MVERSERTILLTTRDIFLWILYVDNLVLIFYLQNKKSGSKETKGVK